MRKIVMLCVCLMLCHASTWAQSKVFKEVSDEISSQIKPIFQDESLVGYLVFTRLEKISDDSFNYKISIMDENLNDIGKVNFKEQSLDLQSVSFDQDVLCMGYLKMLKHKIGTKKSSLESSNADFFIVTQFLNLEGKIIKTNFTPADVKYDRYKSANAYSVDADGFTRVNGSLKHKIQIKNIPQNGFACFYGEEKKSFLYMFSTKGDYLWKKEIGNGEFGFSMMSTKDNIYMLSRHKIDDVPEGGYRVQCFSVKDSVAHEKVELKDKQGNYLKVFTFDTDPATGQPYVAGNVINPKRSKKYSMGRHVAKGAYTGVFTINLVGQQRSAFKETYSYWGDESMNATISKRGYYRDLHSYAFYDDAIRDFQGNTYFVGSTFVKRPKIGTIISSVLLAWTIYYPVFALTVGGTSKVRIKDAILLKQTPQSKLVVDNTVHCNNSSAYSSRMPLRSGSNRSFYTAINNESKTNYLIIDDKKDIFIYNVNTKKTVRTVPHKDGKILTNIYPAKEGHIMVAEYNKKEKYSKFSIEAL